MKWKIDSEVLKKFQTPITSRELKETMSARTVARILHFLELSELISFVGMLEGERGRPRNVFEITPMGNAILEYMDYIEANVPEDAW